MRRTVSSSELKNLIHNYESHKDLPVYTNWGVLMIDEVLPFLNSARNREDNALAIALIRYPLNEDGELASDTGKPRVKTAGMGLSQVSFALITGVAPVKEPWEMTATKNGEEYNILCICEPGHMLIEDPSGLCPPQGNEIIIPGT